MHMLSDVTTTSGIRGNGADTDGCPSPLIRLLIVDDDELFRQSLATNLTEKDFDVVTCSDGKACLEVLRQDSEFDLILLDWRMPEMAGIAVLQEIRAAGIDACVVFLTAFATERNELTAFDCGALDFLDKSHTSAVLARRIRVLVSNAGNRWPGKAARPDVMRLGQLEIQFRTNQVFWDGQAVPLTATEFRVAQLLANYAGENVSYRAIYDVVHGRGFIAGDGTDGYRTNVRSLIKRIRQKFREIDSDFEAIENCPGFGYRWCHEEEPQATNGHAADKVSPVGDTILGAISRLPVVRSMAAWRQRAAQSTDGRKDRPASKPGRSAEGPEPGL